MIKSSSLFASTFVFGQGKFGVHAERPPIIIDEPVDVTGPAVSSGKEHYQIIPVMD